MLEKHDNISHILQSHLPWNNEALFLVLALIERTVKTLMEATHATVQVAMLEMDFIVNGSVSKYITKYVHRKIHTSTM